MYFPLLLISATALGLAQLPALSSLGLSALPLAILFGLLYGNLSPATGRSGGNPALAICQRQGLRLGIALFGFALSFQQVAALGWRVIAVDMVVVGTVLGVGMLTGTRLLGLSLELATLTAIGSAVCGAAAVMAAEPVVKPRQQDAAMAVATVVLFGTVAMLCYPLIFHLSGLDQSTFGVYIGSTVHEVGQAVAAGQAIGADAMRSAVVAKLVRVMLLAPVVLLLGTGVFRDRATTGTERRKVPVPWFVVGFIACVTINSLVMLPPPVVAALRATSALLLTLGMAALGIQTRWHSLRTEGLKPMLLSLALLVLLLGGGFLLNGWLYNGYFS